MNKPRLASTPVTLESVRAEIKALDEVLVEAMLATKEERRLDYAAAFRPPPDEAALRFPELWESACAVCAESEVPLLAFWKRIATGIAVADAKRQATPDLFAEAIHRGDRTAILRAITHPHVEDRVVSRAQALARRLGRAEAADTVATFFREQVIPMTKALQVAELMVSATSGILT